MNDNEKHLDLAGLALFWEKVKARLNLKADKTDLPTKTSQLTNDSGFLTSVAKTDLLPDVQASLAKADTALQSYAETDPTVPAWAKTAVKPTYTAAEVGALSLAEAESLYARKTEVVGVYKYKGSKATAAELPDTGNENGDVWNVEETDMNYGWTGSGWDPLGQSFGVASITAEEIEAIMAG